jgi:hypothetical protein
VISFIQASFPCKSKFQNIVYIFLELLDLRSCGEGLLCVMGEISGEDMVALKCTSFEFSTGWAFKQTDNSDPNAWLPVKKVPSTVHQDLIDNKK